MNQETECVIHIREVYGRPVAYPVNKTAKLFTSLLGTKTLTPQALATISQLGYVVTLTNAYSDLSALEAA